MWSELLPPVFPFWGRFWKAAALKSPKSSGLQHSQMEKVCNNQDFVQCFQTKRSNLTKKGLGSRRDRKSNGQLGWVPDVLWADLEEFQQASHHCSTPPSWVWCQDVQTGASSQINTFNNILRTPWIGKKTKIKCFWPQKSFMFGGNQALLIICSIPSLQAVAASGRWGDRGSWVSKCRFLLDEKMIQRS